MNKYVEIALKLKRLAEESRSTNERKNAQAKLDALLEKRGIIKEELEEMVNDWQPIKVKLELKALFFQILVSILGGSTKAAYNPRKPSVIKVFTTKAMGVELQLRYDFFQGIYEEEKILLQKAIVAKYRLFDKEKEPSSIHELTYEERLELVKVRERANAMPMKPYTKLLGDSQHGNNS